MELICQNYVVKADIPNGNDKNPDDVTESDEIGDGVFIHRCTFLYIQCTLNQFKFMTVNLATNNKD